jgi:site-specific DNA-methyltransferase (adenine-specific)
MLVMSNPNWFKYEVIWEKTIGSGQLNINKQPLRTHESVLVFYENFGTYNEQITKGSPYKITREVSKFKTSYGKQRDHTSVNIGTRRAKSIIKVSNPRVKNGHGTEKPVKLMEYLVKTYSNEGDTVLDFAAGRMTTGIACVNTGRKFIGIELDDYWYEEGCKRIHNYSITS